MTKLPLWHFSVERYISPSEKFIFVYQYPLSQRLHKFSKVRTMSMKNCIWISLNLFAAPVAVLHINTRLQYQMNRFYQLPCPFLFAPLNLFHKKYSLSRHLSNTFLNSLRILSPTTATPPVRWLNRNRYQHGLSISILQFL